MSLHRLHTLLPILGVFVGTLLLVLASLEGGYRWGMRRQAKRELEKEAPVGGMVAATLGLLAFLLAFMFGIASDSFQARREALANETSAIRMTYLLSDVIAEPSRVEIRLILREYTDERLRWADGKADPPGKSARDLLDRLWKSAAVVGGQNPGGVDVFLTYVGRVIELQEERIMVREQSRVPGSYWAVLYLVSLLALSSVGYHSGVARMSRSPVMLAIAIAFSAVIMVIVDLDSPGEGFINVSQQPMVELRDMISDPTRR
jgi:hypothetical protein